MVTLLIGARRRDGHHSSHLCPWPLFPPLCNISVGHIFYLSACLQAPVVTLYNAFVPFDQALKQGLPKFTGLLEDLFNSSELNWSHGLVLKTMFSARTQPQNITVK